MHLYPALVDGDNEGMPLGLAYLGGICLRFSALAPDVQGDAAGRRDGDPGLRAQCRSRQCSVDFDRAGCRLPVPGEFRGQGGLRPGPGMGTGPDPNSRRCAGPGGAGIKFDVDTAWLFP